MSDLDSFFAKKDRKKKKKTPAVSKIKSSTIANTSTTSPSKQGEDASNSNNSSATSSTITTTSVIPPSQQDGWIELEDPKTAQVNTGGRVVKQFKRDGDESMNNTNNATNGSGVGGNTSNANAENSEMDETVEKFSGWSIENKEDNEASANTEEAVVEEPKKPAVYRPAALRSAWKPSGPDVKSVAQFPSLADAAKSNAPEVPQSLKAAQYAARKAAASGIDKPVETRSRPRFINSKTGVGPPRFINSKATEQDL